MAWDFETDPEFQEKLDWIDQFLDEKVEPIDLVFPGLAYHPLEGKLRDLVDPLKREVRNAGLWACHLGPDLGGPGYGQLKLALMNEKLGRSSWAPIIFGTQAPDTGNAEIIAHYGTDEQKEKYLQPLLDGELFSSYSMTEPQGGSDPTRFTTRAEKDGDEWVINGWKFFSSNAKTSSFLIVMVVTNPDVSAYQGMSMFLVPTDTPGVNIVRNVGLMGEARGHEGNHALIHYDNVHVPAENLLGGEGQAFAIAQTRLGGGRIHHAMRTVGMCQKAFDMMCERALSRETQGSLLADSQRPGEGVGAHGPLADEGRGGPQEAARVHGGGGGNRLRGAKGRGVSQAPPGSRLWKGERHVPPAGGRRRHERVGGRRVERL